MTLLKRKVTAQIAGISQLLIRRLRRRVFENRKVWLRLRDECAKAKCA
jgi:hypothetical protein